MVQAGSTWFKKGEGVKFQVIFNALKKRISDGADVPYFFRELMEMITSVSEDEWGTPKDPGSRLTNDNTLRTYSKGRISKKFALSIVYRLTPENLVTRINERPPALQEVLASDFKSYDSSVNSSNIGEKIAGWLVDCIEEAAGLISKDELEQCRQDELDGELKKKYGPYLLEEACRICPFPGCGKDLVVTSNDSTNVAYCYEVNLIDKDGSKNLENMIASCPSCHAIYVLDTDGKKTKELKGVKRVLVSHKQSVRLLDSMSLEKGISGVMKKLVNLKETDLEKVSLDAKELTTKIAPAKNKALYETVKWQVTTYFNSLKDIMIGLDKGKEIDYEDIQNQIHAMYKKLKNAKKSDIDIYSELSEKIHKMTLQPEIYCNIVVSFFIQKCEVF